MRRVLPVIPNKTPDRTGLSRWGSLTGTLEPPADRPWGVRQAVVADSEGQQWVLTQHLHTPIPPPGSARSSNHSWVETQRGRRSPGWAARPNLVFREPAPFRDAVNVGHTTACRLQVPSKRCRAEEVMQFRPLGCQQPSCIVFVRFECSLSRCSHFAAVGLAEVGLTRSVVLVELP